jgi:hypothetical protein
LIIQRLLELNEKPTKNSEFIQKVTRKKVKITLSAEAEWESYFIEESVNALAIKDAIQTPTGKSTRWFIPYTDEPMTKSELLNDCISG